MTLDELDTILAARTPGPWEAAGRAVLVCVDPELPTHELVCDEAAEADVAAIVALVNAAPLLLAEIRAARTLRDMLLTLMVEDVCDTTTVDAYDAARAATEAGG